MKSKFLMIFLTLMIISPLGLTIHAGVYSNIYSRYKTYSTQIVTNANADIKVLDVINSQVQKYPRVDDATKSNISKDIEALKSQITAVIDNINANNYDFDVLKSNQQTLSNLPIKNTICLIKVRVRSNLMLQMLNKLMELNDRALTSGIMPKPLDNNSVDSIQTSLNSIKDSINSILSSANALDLSNADSINILDKANRDLIDYKSQIKDLKQQIIDSK